MRLAPIVAIASASLLLWTVPAAAQPMPEQPMPAPPEEDRSAPAPASAAERFEQLKAELSAGAVETRESAALQLGPLGDGRAVPLLIRALQHDASSRVRRAAARSLGLLRDPAAVGPLELAAKKDPSSAVRREAEAARGELPGGSAPKPRPRSTGQGSTTASADPNEALWRDPDYVSGRRLRLGGMLTTFIGGGVGLFFGLIGLAGYGICDADPGACDYQDPNDYLALGVVGFGLTALSLGVGIPLWVVGNRKMAAATEAHNLALIPQLNVTAGSQGQRLFTARWRF